MSWTEGAARPRPQNEGDCEHCTHPREDHREFACHGLGPEKGMLGSFCPCNRSRYKAFRPAGSYSGSRTYVPPKVSSGFSASSSRNEIGNGRQRGRVNLQHENPGRDMEPEWVMFGIRRTDGSVTVYASTKLSYLRLRQEAGHFEEIFAREIAEGKLADQPWDLSGRMVDYVSETANSYGEAISRLMNRADGWRPDGPTTADLQQQLALEEAKHYDESPAPVPYISASDEEIVDAEIVDDDD